MRKLVIFVCTLCLVGSLAQAVPIENGGFETGALAPWWTSYYDPAAANVTVQSSTVYEGTWAAEYWTAIDMPPDTANKLGQSGDIAAGTPIQISGMYNGTSWAGFGISIEWKDASWGTFAWEWYTVYGGAETPSGWQPFATPTWTAPTGAEHFDVSINQWGWGTTYLDNVNLSVVPEPATMLLLGLGGLVALRRKHA